MTYGERYSKTNGWIARHIAQDLMIENGRNNEITEADEKQIRKAEVLDMMQAEGAV